jgi:clan AA aspartic protease (TIGR02281 family)
MRKFLSSVGAVALTLLTLPAHADMLCQITDTKGNNLVYSFQKEAVTMHASDPGANGNIATFFTEQSFSKNGQIVPVSGTPGWHWFYIASKKTGVLTQDSDPSWKMLVATNGNAILTHGHPAGVGHCQFLDGVNSTPPAPYVPAPAPAPVYTPAPAYQPPSQISVPLTWADLGWHVDVQMGSIRHQMVLDTGASAISLNSSTAEALVARGEAQWGQPITVSMADGREQSERTITINTVSIGGYTRQRVPAMVHNDDNGNELFGVAVLNSAGRFTIDAQSGRLMLG